MRALRYRYTTQRTRARTDHGHTYMRQTGLLAVLEEEEILFLTRLLPEVEKNGGGTTKYSARGSWELTARVD